MKKTLSLLTVLAIASIIGGQSAHAFCWSDLNPAYWGHCPKCEKKKSECGCKKKQKKSPCTTGAAAPCDPCNRPVTQPVPCDACDRLQQEMAK